MCPVFARYLNRIWDVSVTEANRAGAIRHSAPLGFEESLSTPLFKDYIVYARKAVTLS